MAEKLETLYVELRTEAKTLRREINSLRKDVKKEGQKMGSEFGSMFSKGFAAIGGIYAIKKALDFAIIAKNAARDFNEIRSKFQVVFGNISKDTETWAKNFGKSVGRAQSDILKWLGTLQDTFVPLGFARSEAAEFSKSLTKLAVDVASFNNAADDDVLRDFTSALVGNTETVRKYGIVITEANTKAEAYASGLAKQGQELSNAAKVQARMNLIMKGTKDAQGDAIRTASSLANQEKRLNAEFQDTLVKVGQGLVPAFLALTQAGIGWLNVLKDILGVQEKGKVWTTEDLKLYYDSIKKYSVDQIKAEEEAIMKILSLSDDRLEALRELEDASGGLNDELKKKLEYEEQYNQLLYEQFKIINDIRTGALKPGTPNRFESGSGGGKTGINRSANTAKDLGGYADYLMYLGNKTPPATDRIGELSLKPWYTRGFNEMSERDDAGANAAGQRIQEYLKNGAEDFNTDLLAGAQSFGSLLGSVLGGVADGFVGILTDGIGIISQILGISKSFGLGGFFGLFAHQGGAFQGGKKVASFASGGDFMVPGGFNNDSFPMMVESGERVTVTPSNRVGEESKMLAKVYSAIQALNMNLVEKDFSVSVVNNADIKSQVIKGKIAENNLTKAGVNLNGV